MKTSYTIPEVAGICHVSEKLVISWANQGKLKISKVNLENCVYREDLILFMRRVGFSTEALEIETPPAREDILKELLFENRALFYNLLKEENKNLAGSGWEYTDLIKKIEELLGGQL